MKSLENDEIEKQIMPEIICDSELYSQLQSTHYHWIGDKQIEHNIDYYLDVSRSTYLDTNWGAITYSTSEYPTLVTSFLYDCVGLVLLNNEKNIVGLFHISTDISDSKIRNFIDTFFAKTDETSDENNISTILYSGQISSNLTRCREIVLEKNLSIKVCAAHSKIIEWEGKMILSTEMDIEQSFGIIAVNAQNLQTCFSFDADKFLNNYEHSGDMYTQAIDHGSQLLALTLNEWESSNF
jgi:hypothetical protein